MKEQILPLTERQQYWLTQLRACENSGQGMKSHALSEGLDVKALYAWKKALVKKGVLPRTRPARFQRVRTVAPATSSEWQIQLPNGVSVSFVSPMDAGTLSTVLNTASALD